MAKSERLKRAERLAALPGAVTKTEDGLWKVASQSLPGVTYDVRKTGKGAWGFSCTCSDYKYHLGRACKHILAVKIVLDREVKRP